MNAERPLERLARHAGPAEIDEAFSDRLYAVIQHEIHRPERSAGLALLWVAALLTAAVITGTIAVGSGLVEPPWVNRLLMPTATAAASDSAEPSPSPTPTPSRPPGAWTATESMLLPATRAGTATLLPDGTVLVAGGTAGSEVLTSAQLFDPASGSWVATASMLQGREGQTATILSNGTVLVAGGSSRAGGDAALTSAEVYDPVAETWTATGDMTQARSGHTATPLPDGRVLVAGGYATTAPRDGLNVLASAELYDPVAGTWTATEDMTQARNGHTATRLPDGRVLVAGGHSADRLASAELYDPVTETWAATGQMTEPYGAHTATLLPDGTVLVAAGDAPRGPGAIGWRHAAVYDPVTETWAATGRMITARLAHAATLLPDGRVLVSGGRVNGGLESAWLDEVELYDPVSRTWSAIGNMIQARSGHTATLLPDGRVLVAGGAGSDPHASAELYVPGVGSQ